MTWDEFKKMVDEKLAEASIDGSATVLVRGSFGDLEEADSVIVSEYYGIDNGYYLTIR